MNDIQSLLLKITGAVLFGGELPTLADDQAEPLMKEGKAQAVFPLVFSALEAGICEALNPERSAALNEDFLRFAVAGTQNFAEHSELHELMTSRGIPYVVLKGYASAMYYPEPSLRSMGDVDFLVRQADMKRAGTALEEAGFSIDHGSEDDIHIAYKRPPMSTWELHRTVNGIPAGEVGERIREELERTIETAVQTDTGDAVCRVPDKLHHGLILLLHTASHLTSEGVGLRHLCDWVVFSSALSDGEFREIFYEKLKSFGLLRFAQVLTLLGEKYLGAPEREWASEPVKAQTVSEETLNSLTDDILNGGNFGTKDMNRYREIKYISDRGEHTVSSSGILRQGFRTMNEKVRSNHKTLGKYKILMPIGYVAEGGKYLGLMIKGKRKSSGTGQMLKEAAERKRIYSSLELFK